MNLQEEIRHAADILRRGGIILYPTDTVWGLGCDATNDEAVARLFALKERDPDKAMLVLVDSPDRVGVYVRDIPDSAWQVMEVAESPLTLILPDAKGVSPHLTAPDGSLGIRVTREAFSQGLCHRLERPVVSTSANFSGHPAPACFADIDPALCEAVDYVVSYRRGERKKSKPSGIIKFLSDGTMHLIRQ